MRAYHEVSPNQLQSIEVHGLNKEALRQHKSFNELETLAKSYWDKLVRLDSFEPSMVRRPEIMITYDVAPHEIKRC